MPLWMLPDCESVPEDSAYIRSAEPVVTPTPASDIVIPAVRLEKTTSGTGAVPCPGTTRTEPTERFPVPDVDNFCELRGASTYAKVAFVCPPTVTVAGKPS